MYSLLSGWFPFFLRWNKVMTSFFFLSFPNLQMCLWSCLPDFFFLPFRSNSNSKPAVPEFFSSSSPLLSVFLLHSLLSSKTHRRTKHHQPAPTVSAGPQMCTKTTRASEKRMEICCYISALFFRGREREREEGNEGEREGEVWDSSCSFPRLTPPFGLLPSLLTASFF